MQKKIRFSRCMGCGLCTAICPEMFELNENNQAITIYGPDCDIPEELEYSVLDAINSCPVDGIYLYE